MTSIIEYILPPVENLQKKLKIEKCICLLSLYIYNWPPCPSNLLIVRRACYEPRADARGSLFYIPVVFTAKVLRALVFRLSLRIPSRPIPRSLSASATRAALRIPSRSRFSCSHHRFKTSPPYATPPGFENNGSGMNFCKNECDYLKNIIFKLNSF